MVVMLLLWGAGDDDDLVDGDDGIDVADHDHDDICDHVDQPDGHDFFDDTM